MAKAKRLGKNRRGGGRRGVKREREKKGMGKGKRGR